MEGGARVDLDDDEAIKGSESPSANIEEAKENLVAPVSGKGKITG